ncbi:MAG: AAA family ATPase [Bacteroidetes bacterium]|nr:AAA family ATPase [Bacteroidota bacterium]MBL0015834.1 AAA family ATPase [Bacteroidota bacterium]MBP6639042.1 AAA family ATPase [Bacteroidia bacterium]MBP6722811.1 AAA family ATPase [Bacteroidia bacterium]
MAESPEKKAVYFGSLTVEGVKCFKGKETLDLTDDDGKPVMLTVILGNNGTGKTTLLTSLLGMMPVAMPRRRIENALDEDSDLDNFLVMPFRALSSDFPVFLGGTFATYCFSNGDLVVKMPDNRSPSTGRVADHDTPWVDFPLTTVSLLNLLIFPFGAGRYLGRGELVDSPINLITFFHDDRLINAQEYLARLDYAMKIGNKKAENQFSMVAELIRKVIPEVATLTARSNEKVQNFIEVAIDEAAVPMAELSMGYRTMLAMVADIAKKMIDHYPDSSTPFYESAVILIDEIDLHLHPSWQQRILNDLTTHFPNVQFIVTTHSPLVLQSAKKVNLAVLHSTENGVTIKNYKDTTFSGWSPEEILHDLMELDHTHSDLYGELMRKFKDAVIEDRYLEAKALFDQLDKILHPNNVTRRLLKLDLASLTPPEVA